MLNELLPGLPHTTLNEGTEDEVDVYEAELWDDEDDEELWDEDWGDEWYEDIDSETSSE